jgi:hypothetical protein
MNILTECSEILSDLKALRADIKKEDTERIGKLNLRSRAEGIASIWFSSISIRISNREIFTDGIADKYKEGFTRLLKLSSPANRKTSYLEVLDILIKDFNDEVLIPIRTSPDVTPKSDFSGFFEDLGKIPEYDYLLESEGCAENGFFRGAAVLGWSATVYRMHSVIERIGINVFCSESKRIAGLTQGRFKKYSTIINVRDRNELNEVFDTNMLWVLEGMSLIDLNQHTRLRSCFDLRCQCAHPCSAPVTEYNLLSFFSDIKEIVFKNARFVV